MTVSRYSCDGVTTVWLQCCSATQETWAERSPFVQRLQCFYRLLEGVTLWWGSAAAAAAAFSGFLLLMVIAADLLLFRVVHGHNLTLNGRSHQHGQHLHSHPCQRAPSVTESVGRRSERATPQRGSYCRPWQSLCPCDLPQGTCWGRDKERCSTASQGQRQGQMTRVTEESMKWKLNNLS